jgi:hypothetical protein
VMHGRQSCRQNSPKTLGRRIRQKGHQRRLKKILHSICNITLFGKTRQNLKIGWKHIYFLRDNRETLFHFKSTADWCYVHTYLGIVSSNTSHFQ